jgi:hypothetical protein
VNDNPITGQSWLKSGKHKLDADHCCGPSRVTDGSNQPWCRLAGRDVNMSEQLMHPREGQGLQQAHHATSLASSWLIWNNQAKSQMWTVASTARTLPLTPPCLGLLPPHSIKPSPPTHNSA